MSSILSIYARQPQQSTNALGSLSNKIGDLSEKFRQQRDAITTVTLSASAKNAIEYASGQNKVVSSTQTMNNVSNEAKGILEKISGLAKSVESNGGNASKELNSELQSLNKQFNDVLKSSPEFFHNSAKGEKETSVSYKVGDNYSIEIKSQDISNIAKDFGTIDSVESAQKLMKNVESSLKNLGKVDEYVNSKTSELNFSNKTVKNLQDTVAVKPAVPNINDIERPSSRVSAEELIAKYENQSKSKFDLSSVRLSMYA